MSTFQQKPGFGVILKNLSKTADKHPDYKGSILLDRDFGKGSVLTFAGWRKQTAKGELISLRLDTEMDKNKQWPKAIDDNEVPF
jgi:hypothetical protein